MVFYRPMCLLQGRYMLQDIECSSIKSMKSRTKQGHQSRTGVEGESKRRRRDTVGDMDVDESRD